MSLIVNVVHQAYSSTAKIELIQVPDSSKSTVKMQFIISFYSICCLLSCEEHGCSTNILTVFVKSQIFQIICAFVNLALLTDIIANIIAYSIAHIIPVRGDFCQFSGWCSLLRPDESQLAS
jgi:hypothetical protein